MTTKNQQIFKQFIPLPHYLKHATMKEYQQKIVTGQVYT